MIWHTKFEQESDRLSPVCESRPCHLDIDFEPKWDWTGLDSQVPDAGDRGNKMGESSSSSEKRDFLFLNSLYMKSLIANGARSIFMTSEKNVFLCASLYTRLWKTQYWIYNIFFLLVTFGSEMRFKGKG